MTNEALTVLQTYCEQIWSANATVFPHGLRGVFQSNLIERVNYPRQDSYLDLLSIHRFQGQCANRYTTWDSHQRYDQGLVMDIVGWYYTIWTRLTEHTLSTELRISYL